MREIEEWLWVMLMGFWGLVTGEEGDNREESRMAWEMQEIYRHGWG